MSLYDQPMSITLLAQDLGLSISTVSRALNGYTDVSARTRERVAQRAAELGYQPHPGARSLKSGKANAVGVILPMSDQNGQFISGLYSSLLGGIASVLDPAGYSLIASTHLSTAAATELSRYDMMIRSKSVDAFVVVRTLIHDPRVQLLHDRGIPFVTYGRSQLPFEHLWVDADNEGAFHILTHRLIAQGHKRIALLNGPEGYTFALLRATGFEQAMYEHQLPLVPHYVAHGDLSESAGFALAQQMLALPERPTAFLCATDAMAIGCIAACRRAGLRVGQDVSVVGYGNTDAASYCEPPLTTIETRIFENGRHIGLLLMEKLSGLPATRNHYLEPVELIARSSDGPIHSTPFAQATPAH
jgi:LacI family transcriptional regulator